MYLAYLSMQEDIMLTVADTNDHEPWDPRRKHSNHPRCQLPNTSHNIPR